MAKNDKIEVKVEEVPSVKISIGDFTAKLTKTQAMELQKALDNAIGSRSTINLPAIAPDYHAERRAYDAGLRDGARRTYEAYRWGGPREVEHVMRHLDSRY